jgi:F-type H+-transporting ATPase subunit a
MLMQHMIRRLIVVIVCIVFAFPASAADGHGEESEEFDAIGTIMHHISDSHSWTLVGHIAIPLPIIVYSNGHLDVFLSSAFNHGETVVTKGDRHYALYHEKIYLTDASGTIEKDEAGKPQNLKPLDFSITRNVASMWISALMLLLIFISISRKYKRGVERPSGLQSAMEPIILFVRDDIANDMIGKGKADKYFHYLLTVFFFIWINNILGLVPFFPGGSNLSGNISFTAVLAICTLIITNVSGTKAYWKHIVAPPGVPAWVTVFLVPVEIIGIFTKPFALMIRLFANITAGHIILLSLVSMIFILKTIWFAPVSILLGLVMSLLEILVGLLQAFIFTLLSALFIGLATHDDSH